MSDERILLGRLSSHIDCYGAGKNIYLQRHTRISLRSLKGKFLQFGFINCEGEDFDWPFRRLLNENLVDEEGYTYHAKNLFSETEISNNDWRTIKDLFEQAYALRDASKAYRLNSLISNETKRKTLDKDLRVVVKAIWKFVSKSAKERKLC